MASEGDLHVRWTRAELVAVREAIEVTPLFEGRADVRETVRRTLRANGRHVVLDVTLGERLARHLVPIDMQTAIAKVKLLRAVRDVRRAEELAAQAAPPSKPHSAVSRRFVGDETWLVGRTCPIPTSRRDRLEARPVRRLPGGASTNARGPCIT